MTGGEWFYLGLAVAMIVIGVIGLQIEFNQRKKDKEKQP